MKLGQNFCLGEILDEFENKRCSISLGHEVKF